MTQIFREPPNLTKMKYYIRYVQRFLVAFAPRVNVSSMLKANRSYIAAHVALDGVDIVDSDRLSL